MGKQKYPPFTKEDEAFVRAHHKEWNNQRFADHFHMPYRSFCARKSDLGIRNIILQMWTAEQIRYLRKWYKRRGDLELAGMFTRKWYKNKGWTLKHIEKKRMYLGLKRTKKDLDAIRERARKRGVYKESLIRRWAKTARKEGEIVRWKNVLVVKINHKYRLWTRWYWQKYRGKIPKGMKVIFKDGNSDNRRIGNLELITCGELSRRNSKISSQGLSDNYVVGILTHNKPEMREIIRQHPEMILIKRKQLQLNRLIYGNAKNSSAQRAA